VFQFGGTLVLLAAQVEAHMAMAAAGAVCYPLGAQRLMGVNMAARVAMAAAAAVEKWVRAITVVLAVTAW
jgi:hypothetical protein